MKITDNTKAILAEANSRASAGLEKIEPIILGTAKRDVVVVTGALRDSITAEVEGNRLTVGSPLPYAPKIEMDKPFLRPALESNRTKIQEIFGAS